MIRKLKRFLLLLLITETSLNVGSTVFYDLYGFGNKYIRTHRSSAEL